MVLTNSLVAIFSLSLLMMFPEQKSELEPHIRDYQAIANLAIAF